ncbi:MAG: hypothetical protein ACWGQW_06230 [bacterium]
MPKWKIFYTDGTKLLWSDVAANGDPKQIPANKRIGVHSVQQLIDNDTVREVIEQYHYIYSIADMKWVGVGIDGLLDWVVNDLDNIRCILHGRTVATDKFWNIKQEAAADTSLGDVVTASSIAADVEGLRAWFGKNQSPYWQAGEDGGSADWTFTENARHRQYYNSEAPVYGRVEVYN